MEINLIFGMIAIILSAILGLIQIFWDYSNIYLNLAWNPPYNPITSFTKESKLTHKEWLEMGKKSPRKAIRAYNKATGISFWKTLHKKKFIILLLMLLIFFFGILSIYFTN